MNGNSKDGKWKKLVIGSATAQAHKYDDETSISLTAVSVKKKATIKDSDGALKGESVGAYRVLLPPARADVVTGCRRASRQGQPVLQRYR